MNKHKLQDFRRIFQINIKGFADQIKITAEALQILHIFTRIVSLMGSAASNAKGEQTLVVYVVVGRSAASCDIQIASLSTLMSITESSERTLSQTRPSPIWPISFTLLLCCFARL